MLIVIFKFAESYLRGLHATGVLVVSRWCSTLWHAGELTDLARLGHLRSNYMKRSVDCGTDHIVATDDCSTGKADNYLHIYKIIENKLDSLHQVCCY